MRLCIPIDENSNTCSKTPHKIRPIAAQFGQKRRHPNRIPLGVMRIANVILLFAITLAGCTGGDNEGDGADGGPGPDAGLIDAGPSYEDGDWLFEADRVLDVRIELPVDEWDALRFQTRNVLDILGEDCAQGPAPQAFTYRPATVTIEGETFSEAAVRKKGFLGSLSDTKPSLKIKMDEYVDGQHFSGLTRFTLNNAKQDPSYVNQCIGYDLFRKAGVPAPRCNFANVHVNGEDLGLFVHVESVKKPYLRTYFDTDEGNLYEGTLSDFRDGWTATFEKKTNSTEVARPEIDELSAALSLQGDAMREALDAIVDMEEFMTFWAMETLVAHHDGYGGNSNNFYLYGSPDAANRNITFMPWGVDNLFRDAAAGPSVALTRSLMPRSLFAHEASRDQYTAAMRTILNETWEDSEVLIEIARMESLIRPYISATEEEAFAQGLGAIRESVTGREAAFRVALNEIAQHTPDALMEPLCFEKKGSIVTSFDTVWMGGGTATLSVVIDGTPLSFVQQSSVAVPTEEDPTRAFIAVFADFEDTSRAMLLLPIAVSALAPSTVEITDGILLFFPPGSEDFDRAEFVAGTMTLDEASSVTGEAIIGSADLDIWNTPFF